MLRDASSIGDGRQRVVIQEVTPQLDEGRFAVKRVVGEEVRVRAEIFADGHDQLSAVVIYRHESQSEWSEAAMDSLAQDQWEGSFSVTRLGLYFYSVCGWINRFRSWRRDLEKRLAAGQEVSAELAEGAQMVVHAAGRADGAAREQLRLLAAALEPSGAVSAAEAAVLALSSQLADLMEEYSERLYPARYERELQIRVDPVLARCGAWYELFPRSCAPQPGEHGTLKDCMAWLPRISAMGFDVVYLAPIHPIGQAFRKGRNNSTTPDPAAPGSPWAIGAESGGHKAVHPKLGTMETFGMLVEEAKRMGLAIALDIAFQCSPDHPYVREHPQWFRHRPDGSIRYAENPPKKYQDIYPIDFETTDWQALWRELRSIFEFWIDQGVRVFRVDNPHTKSFAFWEWCLGSLKQTYPDLIFLSEAFTRPSLMYRLAKLGFTQSYTYFTWRNTRHELKTYFEELVGTEVSEFFRPNLWLNTPDILPHYLQFGGRAAFMARLILAATLGASYGIYGPPFENLERAAREAGGEEYLNSEKYEIRHWILDGPESLAGLIKRVNQVRRENPALQSNASLRFHPTDNEQLIAYSKRTPDLENVILVVVNLDPHHTQRGWVTVASEDWSPGPASSYQVHELLSDDRYLWTGPRNYVELNPQFVPAHIFRLRRYVRTERDFDYFL